MPLKVEKRKFKDGSESKTYWVRGTIAGNEVFRSTKTSKLAAARKFADELVKEAEQARIESNEKLFVEAAVQYILNGGERRYLERIMNFMSTTLLNDINQEYLERVSKQMFPNHANSTIKRQFWTPVCSVMNFAAEREWCPLKRFRKPKVKETVIKWAETDWYEALWKHCSDNLYRTTAFLGWTGCRVSETINLTWDNVSLSGQWAYIEKTKNGESRTVHLPEIVIEALETVPENERHGKVFKYEHGNSVNKGIERAVKIVNRHRKEEGLQPIPYLSSHKIGSHSYATRMMRDGGLDIKGLTDTGRWKDIRMAARYSHTSKTTASQKSDLLPKVERAKIVHKRIKH